MHDYYTGLDMQSFKVIADFTVDGIPAGANLASKFRAKSQGVWELEFAKPIQSLKGGTITVSISDKQGNVSQIERSFSIARQTVAR